MQLVDRDVGQPGLAHLAFFDQVGQQSELFVRRHLGVDPVQLEQVQAVDGQPPKAHFRLLAQVLGPPDRVPLSGSGADQPGLGGDDQALGVGVESLADQVLAHVWTVGIRGVDEIHAELDRPAQDADALLAVGRLAPDAPAREPHGPETQAVEGQTRRR